MPWSARFDEPIPLSIRGRVLPTFLCAKCNASSFAADHHPWHFEHKP